MTVAFLVLAFYFAVLVIVALHEVVGHGGAAVLLGGTLDAVFVSPLGGVAYGIRVSEGWQRVAVTAAGPATNVAAGLLLWPLLSRMRGFAWRVMAWELAFGNLLMAIIYVGVGPLLEAALGTAQGDGTRVFAALGIPLLPAALAAILGGTWVMARGMRRAQDLIRAHLAPARFAGPFAATWRLIGPGLALVTLYYALVLPSLDPFFVVSYPFLLAVVAMLTALGAGLLALLGRWVVAPSKRHPAAVSRPALPPSPVELVSWSALALAVALGCLLVFGPTPP